MSENTDTNAFLQAHHYEHLNRKLLRPLNKEIGELKQSNGGNADLFIRLRAGVAQWLESTKRTLFPQDN